VWRLHAAGHSIVYDPDAIVRHNHRTRPAEFWPRRFDYARSIGPLARRHPHALPALHAEPWSTAVIASLILRRPGLAAIVTAARWWSIRPLPIEGQGGHRLPQRSGRPMKAGHEGLDGTSGTLGRAPETRRKL
jgi:GT2 family glycosyltransferase